MKKTIIVFMVMFILCGFVFFGVNADSVNSTIESSGGIENAVYIRNFRTGFFVKKSSSFNEVAQSTDRSYSEEFELFEWVIRDEGNDQVSIRYYADPSLVISVENDSVVLSTAPAVLTDNYKWKISQNTPQSGYVYIKSCLDDKYLFAMDDKSLAIVASYGSFAESTYWKIANSINDDYISMTSFDIQYSDWMAVGSTQQITVSVTPENAQYSSQIAENFSFVSENKNIVEILSTGLIQAKSEGSTCIIVKHRSSAKAHKLPIVVGQIFENGDYYLGNRSTGGFCDNMASTAKGVNLIDAEWNMNLQQQWTLTYLENGYYTIVSKFSGLFLAATNAKLNNNIIRQISISDPTNIPDNAQWRIIKTTQGAYYLISKGSGSSNYALNCRENLERSMPTTLSLIQTTYVDDFSYQDEWYITNVNDILTSTIPIMGLEDNKEFLFLNVKSGRFMYQGNPNSSSDDLSVYTSKEYNEKNAWTLKIRNTSLGMCIISKNVGNTGYKLNSTNGDIQLSTGGSSYKIQRVNINPYEGTYIITYGTKYISQDLATGQIILTNQFSESCVWSISSYNRDKVQIFNFTGGSETNGKILDSLQGAAYSCFLYNGASAYDGYMALKDGETDIFIFRGHANPGLISFDGTWLTIESAVSENIDPEGDQTMMRYEENELASIQIACFLGCHSGGIVTNGTLQDVAFNKGAHFAIATFDTVYAHNSDYFLRRFCRFLYEGYNVETAMWMAQYEYDEENPDYSVYLPSYDMTSKCYPIIFIGDIYQRINNFITE